MLKSQKLKANVTKNNSGDSKTEFKLTDISSKATSINNNMTSDEVELDNIQKVLKEYEKEAKNAVGGIRKAFRKPEPKKPLLVRVREAMKMQEELEM